MTIVTNTPVAPVLKTITVQVSVERAFDVFTAGRPLRPSRPLREATPFSP